MKVKQRRKKIIGRREMVNFPGLGVNDIEAKIDTGAYTSSIHCREVKLLKKDDLAYVSFLLLDEAHPLSHEKPIEWPLYKVKQIKNSFGQVEERYVIKTEISFFDELYEIEISLADRSLMDYPLLLGRKALKRRFVVDVSKLYYAQKKKNCIIE